MSEAWNTAPSNRASTPSEARYHRVESRFIQGRTTRMEFALDPAADDSICKSIAAGQFPESTRPAIDCLLATFPKGGRVLDLGAHVGSFTLAAGALGYQVVGVEASERNAHCLQTSIERNQLTQVRLIHAAVGDHNGRIRFSQGGPYGQVDLDSSGPGSLEVALLRVDELVAELGWDQVDFIKMDIEGSEVAGLRGMSRLLSSERAPTLFVESNGFTLERFGESPSSLKHALAAHGYRCYLIESQRLCPAPPEDFQAIACVDYLASKHPIPSVEGYRLDPALTVREQSVRIAHSAHSIHPPERLFIARVLNEAPIEVRQSPRVHRSVARLQRDECAEVRACANSIELPPARRDWNDLVRSGVAWLKAPRRSTRE